MFSGRSLVRVELARVQGTLAALVETVAASNKDHEDRLRRVEHWLYAIPLSAAAIAVTAIVQLLHK